MRGLNQQPELKFTDLVARYLLAKEAEGKSPATIRGYREILKPFNWYLEEHGHGVFSINRDVADEYLVFLRQRPRFPNRPTASGSNSKLAEESVRDHLRTLKACFSWLVDEGYLPENAFRRIKLSRSPAPIIQPLSDDEVITILGAISKSTPTGQRNRIIVEIMLDAGCWSSDMAGAKVAHYDPAYGALKVLGKGGKERVVPLGLHTSASLRKYISDFRPKLIPDPVHLFITKDGKAVSVNAIKLMFSQLARKSGVTRLHAHLCRHTFAINYLMNGGDIFSHKIILEHTSFEMVNRYLHFTTAQIAVRHREFSPMDRIMNKRRDDDK